MTKTNHYAEHKTRLTPAEKLRVAVAVLADGIDQHKVAALMGVNQGRIGEFISKIRNVLEDNPDNGNDDSDSSNGKELLSTNGDAVAGLLPQIRLMLPENDDYE